MMLVGRFAGSQLVECGGPAPLWPTSNYYTSELRDAITLAINLAGGQSDAGPSHSKESIYCPV